jgi:Holliday junction resolvasome RuvABC endonuclease subunit
VRSRMFNSPMAPLPQSLANANIQTSRFAKLNFLPTWRTLPRSAVLHGAGNNRNSIMNDVIMGIDISARSCGFCVIPAGWDMDWTKVVFANRGHKLDSPSKRERLSRRLEIAHFASQLAQKHGVTSAWVESDAFSYGGKSSSVLELAKIKGVVELHLWTECGLFVDDAPISTARKLALGKVPRGKGVAKAAVLDLLRRSGAVVENDDQSDAWAAANYGMSELGLGFVGVVG